MNAESKPVFQEKEISAYEAIDEAQKIAFAPLIFQAVRSLRELGILKQLESHQEKGVTAQKLTSELELSLYGVETLLESGMSCGVVHRDLDGRFTLSKVGHYLLHDPMTRINMDFNHDVCYQGMFYLDEAVKTGNPSGLKVFGDQWETLYQALPHLPGKVKQSWYAFDHFYSDTAYPAALNIILADGPRTLVDIGTNIGKFALLAGHHDPDLHITMVDLPDQLQNAIRNVEEAGLSDRVTPLGIDLLDEASTVPAGADVYWLSQFLSCFGKDEIISILSRIAGAMEDNSTLYILETCWDRQQHKTSSYSLINTSLYFTAMASGNSKMYHSSELMECIEKAGLELNLITDDLGLCHSLFACKKVD
ncbi:SAM-dependent methyltransferase [Marinobacter nauticus]